MRGRCLLQIVRHGMPVNADSGVQGTSLVNGDGLMVRVNSSFVCTPPASENEVSRPFTRSQASMMGGFKDD